jgi:hypothetical protein
VLYNENSFWHNNWLSLHIKFIKNMKYFTLLFAVLLLSVSTINAQSTAKAADKTAKTTKAPKGKPVKVTGPQITFTSMTMDYGTIPNASNGDREFTFKNTGKEPLIISGCSGSCGCTVPTCPKEAILPGKTGTIKVHYDTNRTGAFSKNVTVQSNDPSGPKVLTISGTVNAPQ